MHALVVDLVPLPPQQDMDPFVPIANAARGQVANALPERLSGRPPGLVPHSRPGHPYHPTRMPFADPILPAEMAHHSPALWCAHHFFAAISCSITLSKLNSATSFLSLVFSSRSCLSSRTSVASKPPYCFFQR